MREEEGSNVHHTGKNSSSRQVLPSFEEFIIKSSVPAKNPLVLSLRKCFPWYVLPAKQRCRLVYYTYPDYMANEHAQSNGKRYFISAMLLAGISGAKYGKNQQEREE